MAWLKKSACNQSFIISLLIHSDWLKGWACDPSKANQGASMGFDIKTIGERFYPPWIVTNDVISLEVTVFIFPITCKENSSKGNEVLI